MANNTIAAVDFDVDRVFGTALMGLRYLGVDPRFASRVTV